MKHEAIMTISASALQPSSPLSEEPCPPLSPFKSPADAGADAGNQHPSAEPVRVNGGPACFSFGPFRLIPTQRLLLEAEKPLRLGSRALDILIALVERRGELVSKEELMARVWPKMFVEPANLTVHVAAVRRGPGDGRNATRHPAKNPRRGATFRAPVTVVESEMPPLALRQ